MVEGKLMKRQTGYYWVKRMGVWHVAKYYQDGEFWVLCSTSQTSKKDKHFELINERRIEEPK